MLNFAIFEFFDSHKYSDEFLANIFGIKSNFLFYTLITSKYFMFFSLVCLIASLWNIYRKLILFKMSYTFDVIFNIFDSFNLRKQDKLDNILGQIFLIYFYSLYIDIYVRMFIRNFFEFENYNFNMNDMKDIRLELFSDKYQYDYIVMLPEISLMLSILFILILGVFFFNININYKQKTNFQKNIIKYTKLCINDYTLLTKIIYISIIALIYYIILLVKLKNLDIFDFFDSNKLSFWRNIFQINNFIIDSKIFLACILIIILTAGVFHLKDEKIYSFEYIFLILLSFLGMIIMMSSNDLILFYISLELQSLALYILVAFRTKSLLSTDASLKYFILGAFASGLVLLGISIIYGWVGTVNFDELRMFLIQLDKGIEFTMEKNLYVWHQTFEDIRAWDSFRLQKKSIDLIERCKIFHPMEYRFYMDMFRSTFKGNQDNMLQYLYKNINHHLFNLVDKNHINFELLNINYDYNKYLSVGFILILAGIFFKLAIAPFHLWAPDIYEESPTYTAFIIATLPKISVFVFFINFYLPILKIANLELLHYPNNSLMTFGKDITDFTLYVVIFSLIIGTINGLNQTKIKRLLAYSTVVNSSLAILPILIGNSIIINGKEAADIHVVSDISILVSFSSVFYFFVYILSITGIFLILLNLKKFNNIKFEINSIYQLTSIAKNNKSIAIMLSIFLFSLGGIPPLLGFFSKFYIFLMLLELQSLSAQLAIFIIFITLLSTFYYLRIIRIMFFNPTKQQLFLKPINNTTSLFIILIILFNITFIIFPEIPLYIISSNLAMSYEYKLNIYDHIRWDSFKTFKDSIELSWLDKRYRHLSPSERNRLIVESRYFKFGKFNKSQPQVNLYKFKKRFDYDDLVEFLERPWEAKEFLGRHQTYDELKKDMSYRTMDKNKYHRVWMEVLLDDKNATTPLHNYVRLTSIELAKNFFKPNIVPDDLDKDRMYHTFIGTRRKEIYAKEVIDTSRIIGKLWDEVTIHQTKRYLEERHVVQAVTDELKNYKKVKDFEQAIPLRQL